MMHTSATIGMLPTATVEDYLALLYVFERDGQLAIATRLAEQLDVSLPTATATVKRMVRDGWVSLDEKKGIHLTPDGDRIARSVMRRHYLVESLLRHVLDVPWSRIHEEAHAIEHTITDDTLERMQGKLKNPLTCPHGNPLPGEEHAVAHWVRLINMKPGESGTLRRIHEIAENNRDLMAFLEMNKLMPGARITVREVLPFNHTLTLEVNGSPVVLGATTAEWLYVDQSHRTMAKR